MTQENLALWNAVRTPDPAFTKSFSRSGGFKGTATNVVYLIQVATEKWGPMGGKWGVEIVDERVLTGAPILADGVVICNELIHTIRIALRHPDGVVPGIGQTTFVGKNKNGLFTDEEAPKKSLTDALSKAMSWLGFAADIHLGYWDDNKYVNDVRHRFEDGADAKEHKAAVPTITAPQAATIKALAQAASVDEFSLLTWISDRAGKEVASLAAIPASAYTKVIAALAKRAGIDAPSAPDHTQDEGVEA